MSTFGFKVMNLVVRTIAKPLISWVTHYKKLKFKEESGSKLQIFMRNKLISLGQKWNYYNVTINRKLFKISTGNTNIAELSDVKALELGAEVFGEFLVYSLLILIPILEWIRLSNIAKAKEAVKENYKKETNILIDLVVVESEEIDREISEIKKLICELEDKLKLSYNRKV